MVFLGLFFTPKLPPNPILTSSLSWCCFCNIHVANNLTWCSFNLFVLILIVYELYCLHFLQN